MQRIFAVHEIDEWPKSRNINFPAWGLYSNLEAAENFVKDCYQYRKAFVIIETDLNDSWPIDIADHKHNELTYYFLQNGEMIKE